MAEQTAVPNQDPPAHSGLSIGIIGALLLTGLYVLVNFALSWLIMRFTGAEHSSLVKLLIAPCMAAGAVAVITAARVSPRRILSSALSGLPAASGLPFLILMPIALQIAGSELDVLAKLIEPPNDIYRSLIESLRPDGTILDLIGAFFTLALVGPMCEEIIFRGILLPGLKAHFDARFWIANFFQAAFFALSHLNFWQMFYAFPMGFFFGYVRLRTRGLFLPVVFHAGNNLLAVAALYFFPDMPYFSMDNSEHIPVYLLLPALLTLALYLILIGRKKMETIPAV